ncbi:hypothetical protein OSB04_003467 [Centaurea solstitialis]|uniref:Uncharacterized protein n=1 Tax=Centaurea solstitialis TaxID=347529 RepID=A0AA38WVQ5_9ASTR|nr:hypothetical protein OSB04_003467 [Centaurea solstitialis]
MGYEEPPNPSKKCNFLKDALATCHTFCRKISFQTQDDDDDDDDVSDYDDEQEVMLDPHGIFGGKIGASAQSPTPSFTSYPLSLPFSTSYPCKSIKWSGKTDPLTDLHGYEVFVSAVLSRYMEAKSKRKVGLSADSFIWGFSSPTELLPTKKETQSDVEDVDEFYSSCSHLSRCSSATTAEAFMSVRTNLSRCSSTGSFEFPILTRRRSIIRELCHCEGWPFGLCRKALLVPPLPKSPSESWMWRKPTRIIRIP